MRGYDIDPIFEKDAGWSKVTRFAQPSGQCKKRTSDGRELAVLQLAFRRGLIQAQELQIRPAPMSCEMGGLTRSAFGLAERNKGHAAEEHARRFQEKTGQWPIAPCLRQPPSP